VELWITDLVKKYIVAVLLPVLLMLGCSTMDNDGIGPVSNDDIGSVSNDGIGSVKVSFSVIRSGSDLADGTIDTKILESYFDQVSYDNAVNLYSLPVGSEIIDFESNHVVLVTMGGGNATIAAGSIIDVGDYLELEIRFHSAGADCVTLPVIANPFLTLKVNSLKEVRIVERKVTKSCS